MIEVGLGNGQRIAVQSSGGDGPAVLLAHGLTATHRYVLMGSRALERRGCNVIGYDARGHGESQPATEPSDYGYPSLVDDAFGVLGHLDVDSAVIVGVSMGAHTATAMALSNPSRVSGLVLVTPAFDPTVAACERDLARWDELADALADNGTGGFLEVFADGGAKGPWGPVVRRAVAQRMALHRHPESVADALRCVPRSAPFSDPADLASVECPVAVVGSRDDADPGHPLDVARKWAEWLPSARLHVEAEGEGPIAWRGRVISEIVEEVIADTS